MKCSRVKSVLCDEVRPSVHSIYSLINSTTVLAVRANPRFALEFGCRLTAAIDIT